MAAASKVMPMKDDPNALFYAIESAVIASATPAIKITKLAQGLPVGGEIEQLDDGTLFSAFKNRVPVTND